MSAVPAGARPIKTVPVRFATVLDRIPVTSRSGVKSLPGYWPKLVLVGETTDGRVVAQTRKVALRPRPTEEEALAFSSTVAATINRRKPLGRGA